MRPIVKICGQKRAEDVHLCARYGVDILGFVVEYPRPVPWNLSVQQAKELVTVASGLASLSQARGLVESCVVTGGTPKKVVELVSAIKPDYVQLHHGESLADTLEILREVRKHGVKVIKTLFPDTNDLEKTAVEFSAIGIYALLLDPRIPDNALCSGTVDLALFARLQNAASCPVILAGGIAPDNVAEMVLTARPHMIDLMSGVECAPGVKDELKIKTLFEALEEV